MAAVIGLPGCINAYYRAPYIAIDEHAYASLFPYFAEYCALSEFNKKKGFGVDLEGGGPGGHSVFYLNGACRVARRWTTRCLTLCDETPQGMAGRGVGLSVNDHYRNANWTATEGRDFFFDGDLAPGEGVTRASYERIQQKAKAMGILDGVVYHHEGARGQTRGDVGAGLHVRGCHRLRLCGRHRTGSILRAGPAGPRQDGNHRALSEWIECALPDRPEGVPLERAARQLHVSSA